MSRVALVPGVLALLPTYAGLTDPVAELRTACLAAVSWLGDDIEVLADPQGTRVADALLAVTSPSGGRDPSYLVVGNGSACRSEKAPGHLDDRAFAFDRDLEAFLRGAGPMPSLPLGAELQAATLGLELLSSRVTLNEPIVDYVDDPYGVQYWVMRWELA